MASLSRLRTAIEDGVLVLPEGPVTVMRPAVDYDIAALKNHDAQVMHSLCTSHRLFADADYPVSREMLPAKTAIVVVPRSKALARAMVAEAAAKAELVVIDGAKTDGVESLWTATRKVLGPLPSVTKDHGRIFWFAATDAFADWAAPPPAKGDHGFYTTAGVFSDGGIDKGSALLAAALPVKLPKRMADLGAGWGYLSDAVLQREGLASLDLIEAEALALDCAKLNITDPRAQFHWADATSYRPEVAYDGIVMNPPFHVGRKGDTGLGQAFITQAARMLTPQGKLWMVANRHLPYETTLRDAFRHVEELPGSGGFKIFHATRPQR